MSSTGIAQEFPHMLYVCCPKLGKMTCILPSLITYITINRTLDVPFPTARLASIALKTLQVDKELSPLVRRELSLATPASAAEVEGLKDSLLHVRYTATTNRMLRVAVNSFMDNLALVLEVMGNLDTDVLSTEN